MMRLTALALTGLMALAAPAAAQSLFAPVAHVDGAVVTAFEVGQRQRMLQIFGAPETSAEDARDDLIDERLQLAEAERLGIAVTPEELAEGMAEFAGRAQLGVDEFVGRLNDAGVAVESYEDFVRAGIAWREVVAQRFGNGQTQVAPDEVERAAAAPPEPALRVLLNEIIIPADRPERAQRAQSLVPEISAISTYAGFAQAARNYSATPSRERGGAIDWLRLDELPPQIAQILRGLSPGEVSPPVSLPNAVAFFQLRELGEVTAQTRPTTLEYATLTLPGGRSPQALAEAGRIAARVDTCDDLYGVARDLPPEQLRRESLPLSQIPDETRLELAKLDPGEISTGLTASGWQTLRVLMLCDRSYRAADADEPDLGAVQRGLVNQRVAQKSENLLAELRANAAIRLE